MSEAIRSGSVGTSPSVSPDGIPTQPMGRGDSARLVEAPPLVPPGGFFEGQVAILGDTHIAGGVRGTLKGPGSLILAAEARIEGVVDCLELVCRGEIVGPVTARARAELAAGARLDGELDSPLVAVSDGAVWTGVARIGAVGGRNET